MPTILLVEDEPSIADAVTFVLRQEGFRTEVAPTLGEARAAWSRADLLILDIGLPDGNGLDFCRELRRTSATPVIFLTARQEEVDRILGLELGGDDYVTKPFSPRELAARVKSVLRRTGSEENPATAGSRSAMGANSSNRAATPAAQPPRSSSGPLCRGSLFVDLERASAVVGDEPVELTRQELILLDFLARHPGRVFSRTQLMEGAWESPGSATERTVDAHVKTLRAKLRAAGSDHDWVATHRGFGYSFEADPERPRTHASGAP